MNAQHLKAIEAEEQRRSLMTFLVANWPEVEPGRPFIPTRLFTVLCDVLEQVAYGRLPRLVINVPPRSGKSTLVSVLFVAWVLTWRPQTRFLTCSYGEDLAERDSLRSRRLISSAAYQEWHGDSVQLRSDQNTKLRFETTRGGGRVAVSVNGAATGEGGDIIIADDLHKLDFAHSQTALRNDTDWYRNVLATRLNDQRTGSIIIIGQRVSENDITQHVLAEGDWHHVCLPLEYDPDHPHRSDLDWRGTDGELLIPERYGAIEVARQKRRMGVYAVASQLQQLPAPAGGGLFERRWFRYYLPADLPQRFDKIVQAWDLTYGRTESGDFVEGQLWGRLGPEKFLIRRVRGRFSFPETIRQIEAMIEWANDKYPRHRGHAIQIEDAANGAAAIQILKQRWPGVIRVTPRLSKIDRADAVTPQVEAGNVWLPGAANADGTDLDPARTEDWVQAFVQEVVGFPNSRHDDAVDAMSMGLSGVERPEPRVRALIGR
jgi:predicted phage terminase large subunit-like protein